MLHQRTQRPVRRQADGSFLFSECGIDFPSGSSAVRVRAGVIDAASQARRRTLPAESCGLLLVAGGEVRAIATVPNRAAVPDAFEIDMLAAAALVELMRPRGLKWCGWFHSHVRGAPTPSRRDRETTAAFRRPHLHLIVGPRGAWRLYAVDSAGWRPVAVRLVAGEQRR